MCIRIFSLLLQLLCITNAFVARKATVVTTFIGPATGSFSLRESRRYAKKKFKINQNISGDVSSDGLLSERKILQEKERSARDAVKSTLGVSSKRKMASKGAQAKKLSKKAQKLAQERNGDIDSTLQAGLSVPQDQDVQIKVAKRGSKQVTIVRGLTSPMDERKKLLKDMKTKLGGGGSMIEGVLELQGEHGEKILELLKKKGFSKAKMVN